MSLLGLDVIEPYVCISSIAVIEPTHDPNRRQLKKSLYNKSPATPTRQYNSIQDRRYNRPTYDKHNRRLSSRSSDGMLMRRSVEKSLLKQERDILGSSTERSGRSYSSELRGMNVTVAHPTPSDLLLRRRMTRTHNNDNNFISNNKLNSNIKLETIRNNESISKAESGIEIRWYVGGAFHVDATWTNWVRINSVLAKDARQDMSVLKTIIDDQLDIATREYPDWISTLQSNVVAPHKEQLRRKITQSNNKSIMNSTISRRYEEEDRLFQFKKKFNSINILSGKAKWSWPNPLQPDENTFRSIIYPHNNSYSILNNYEERVTSKRFSPGYYLLLVFATVDRNWGKDNQGYPPGPPQSYLSQKRSKSKKYLEGKVDKKDPLETRIWSSEPVVVHLDRSGDINIMSVTRHCAWWRREHKKLELFVDDVILPVLPSSNNNQYNDRNNSTTNRYNINNNMIDTKVNSKDNKSLDTKLIGIAIQSKETIESSSHHEVTGFNGETERLRSRYTHTSLYVMFLFGMCAFLVLALLALRSFLRKKGWMSFPLHVLDDESSENLIQV